MHGAIFLSLPTISPVFFFNEPHATDPVLITDS